MEWLVKLSFLSVEEWVCLQELLSMLAVTIHMSLPCLCANQNLAVVLVGFNTQSQIAVYLALCCFATN